MRKVMIRMVVAALAATMAVPAVAQTAHPLVWKIVETRTGIVTDLTDPALVRALFPCGAITLLGEVHDNADHHRMRAKLLEVEHDAGGEMRNNCGGPAFVFEHITSDQQTALDEFWLGRHRTHGGTVDSLLRHLQWGKSGWPSALLFRPLLQQAIRLGSRIVPGNPAREVTRKVAKQGLDALDTANAVLLGLDVPLAPASNDALLSELEASHCGLMPKSAFGNMAVAQRYRDSYMADVALKASEASGNVVIFAGNGHVRTDRGIPYYLKQRAPERTVIAVAFTETEDGKLDPATYGPRDAQGKPAAGYVAFAAPAQRDDPCEEMRAQFKAKPKQP